MDQPSNTSPILGNRYQLLQLQGTGGMAVVYRARDLMLERPVAVKVLRQDYSQNDAFRERFRQEARSAANLTHPNIVTVHDFGVDKNERVYIVMEYVRGEDLKTKLRKRGRIPLQETLDLMIQACEGIGYAHRAGLIHCDVKPHNMLVTPDMVLKVTDFGIARALVSISPNEKHDVVWGSPQYFSPEQASGQAPSPASDVYSLGVILYEMLTGRLPFTSDNSEELARLHKEAVPPPPRQFNQDIPVELERIILKILSKEPSSRYRSAVQLGQVLRNIRATSGHTVSQPVTVQPVAAAAAPAANRISIAGILSNFGLDEDFDPMTILLGLFTLLVVGGLIPFWLYIWYAVQTP